MNTTCFQARGTARGFSLVELMVSLALGLFLVGGMLTLLAQNSGVRSELDKAGRQVENGRYAVQRLVEDLHHAGYYGEFSDLPTPATPGFPVALPDACDTSLATLKTAMTFPVQAYTAAATPPSCIDAADFVANSNVLVVRFASPDVLVADGPAATAIAGMSTGVVYLQSNPVGTVFAVAATAATTTPANAFASALMKEVDRDPLSATLGQLTWRAPIYRYITRLYFISPCSHLAAGQAHCTAAADDGSPVPTLKMVELGSNGTTGLPPTYNNGTAPAFSTTPVAVAEGVERLEFQYGLDADGDGAADSYDLCNPCSTAQWITVVTARVNVLARNTEPTPDYTDDKTYDLGLAAAVSPPAGATRYKRHVYQMLARVNNQSMRKE
jgi:type IV pilus assembly protein PilW